MLFQKPFKHSTFVKKKLKPKHVFIFLLLVACSCFSQNKSAKVQQLENEIATFNTNAQYHKAVILIKQFVDAKESSPEDVFYAYIALSNTYKCIFDYDNVFIYIDSASSQIHNISTNKQFYIDNINCLKAFALFDIQKYDESNVIMLGLIKNNFKNIETSKQAYIIMQMAYIEFLNKNYLTSEELYNKAIVKLKISSQCDLPIVYGKMIALYAQQNNPKKVDASFKKAYRIADSCNIHKYRLYAVEMMRNAQKDVLKDYKTAYRYFDLYDSINTIYNADGFKKSLKELEVKYESAKKQHAIEIQEKTISAKNRLNAILISVIIALALFVLLVYSWQRRKRIALEQKHTIRFTKQLLEKTEEERKRIATDLHDSVNNELLLIQSSVEKNPEGVKSKIDSLINLVRTISRNLHPVMFDELGLQESVEQLAIRVQEHNRFILNTEIEYKNCLTVSDELQVYRIIQEAVNNILKYSQAVAGLIKIKEEKQSLLIEIKDNGKGFNVPQKLNNSNSFGLHNIIERSRAINGTATITSNGNGTIIQIIIPINKTN